MKGSCAKKKNYFICDKMIIPFPDKFTHLMAINTLVFGNFVRRPRLKLKNHFPDWILVNDPLQGVFDITETQSKIKNIE